MTVLLVLFFIIVVLSADAVIQWKRTHASSIKRTFANGVIQELFEHDDMLPTMADGGKEKKKE